MPSAGDRQATADEYGELLEVLDYFSDRAATPPKRLNHRTTAKLSDPSHQPRAQTSASFSTATRHPSVERAAPLPSFSVDPKPKPTPDPEAISQFHTKDGAPPEAGTVELPFSLDTQKDGEFDSWEGAGFSPWESVRTESVDAASLVALYPEAWGSDFLRPFLSEPDDLYQDKVEREVYQLELSTPERDEMRSLLTEFRHRASRDQIMALLERGRTPREIRQISRVRMRCQAIFSEFPRAVVFGLRFSGGGGDTVGWRLAEALFLAGIYQRGELFRYFRSVCDHLSSAPDCARILWGALTIADQHLRYPRGLTRAPDESSQITVSRRVQHLCLARDWAGESADVWKRLDFLRTLGWAGTRSSSSTTPVWTKGFRVYVQVALSFRPATTSRDLICAILQVESPVRLSYLQRRLKTCGMTTRVMTEVVDTLVCERLAIIIGEDYWWGDHYRYFRLRKSWIPRLPQNSPTKRESSESYPPYSPSLSEAPLLDVGLALTRLQSRFLPEQLDSVWQRLFERWGASDRELQDRERRAQSFVSRYQSTYGQELL